MDLDKSKIMGRGRVGFAPQVEAETNGEIMEVVSFFKSLR